MAPLRTCTEPGCANKLVNADGSPKPAGTKTCSVSCRQKRARRLKRQASARGAKSPHAPELQPMAAAVRKEVKDAVHEVAVEELRPLVREAMTQEVLDSIGSLVKLTPQAIQVLALQLASEDETIAQRAATLMLKYTMGNPSVAPAPTEKAPAPMSVVFNIPRPGDDVGPTDTTPATTSEAQEIDEADELRQCTDCSQHKPCGEFVGASTRCQECFDKLHDTLRERFAETDPTAPA